jgi:hypothetical protein
MALAVASLLASFVVWIAIREERAPTPEGVARAQAVQGAAPGLVETAPVTTNAEPGPPAIAGPTGPANAEFARWSSQWTLLLAEPPSPDRASALCALLEDLAAREPLRARDLALAETTEPLRTNLLRAALGGWASVDLESAGRWALTQTDIYQDAALAAVFHGARSQPDEAVRYARRLSQATPARAGDVGQYLIFALGEADEHQRATRYAAEGEAFAKEWLVSAYAQWSRHDPPAAIAATTTLSDFDQRRTAYRAAISGWAKVDPPALLQYAEHLHPGSDRDYALVTALRGLATRAPETAAAWLVESGPVNGVETVLED